MSFKFGLSTKNKAPLNTKSSKPAPSKRKPIFEDEDEDSGPTKATSGNAQEILEFNLDDTLPTPSEISTSKPAPKPKKGQPPAPPSRKPKAREDDPTTLGNSASAQEAERRAQEAVEIDSSIYDYDAAYDALSSLRNAKVAAARADAAEGRPKYIENLYESSEIRKKDQLRAKDKLLKREREAEGDEFADKEKFVTGAYKAQQEETRLAEEEEKKRLEAEEEKRRRFGMQGFRKQMLMEEEERHREAVEAAAKMAKEGGGAKPPQEEQDNEKTDAQIVEEMKAQGKDVVLDEQGQIADKRQLLKAGLNIIAKPKPPPTAASSKESTKPIIHQANQGRAGARAQQRERQTQMVVQQIEQAAKRKADEDAEEQRKLQHASKSQKTEGEISSAKERYLARKKEKEAAKAAGEK